MSENTVEAPRLLIPARHQAAKKLVDYNSLDDIKGRPANEVSVAEYEFYLAQKLGTKLMQTYPQRQWGVCVSVDAGHVQITCPSLSATKGHVIHLQGKNVHDLERAAIMAGGEILERFGISRGRAFNPDVFETLERDSKDEAVSADSAAGYALKTWH